MWCTEKYLTIPKSCDRHILHLHHSESLVADSRLGYIGGSHHLTVGLTDSCLPFAAVAPSQQAVWAVLACTDWQVRKGCRLDYIAAESLVVSGLFEWCMGNLDRLESLRRELAVSQEDIRSLVADSSSEEPSLVVELANRGLEASSLAAAVAENSPAGRSAVDGDSRNCRNHSRYRYCRESHVCGVCGGRLVCRVDRHRSAELHLQLRLQHRLSMLLLRLALNDCCF